MGNRTLIKDLKASQFVDGVFAIHNCQLGQTKTGKPFLKCLLADRSARTPGRMWNATPELFKQLPTDGFVWIAGQTQPYQGEMQIIIQQIRPIEPSADDLSELLPSTTHDIEEMFSEVVQILGRMTHEPLRHLARAYLEDNELMAQFRQAPAAMTLHHAYLGGLLEHTLNVLRLAQTIGPMYEELNQDLMVTGLFLHDLGKCSELTWETGFGYSEEGNLVGHVARGLLWLETKAEQCARDGHPLTPSLLRVLQHIILSHHGELEFGALKVPATPEAIAVSMLDNLDAKLHMAMSAADRKEAGNAKDAELGGNFTEKIWSLATRIYRPDPTTVDE